MNRKYGKRTRSRGALDAVQGPAGIRDRVIGQYRDSRKRAFESPDEQDRFRRFRAVPLVRTTKRRPGLGISRACAECGRTEDLWEENNGEGISKNGRHFCCKPCYDGKGCTCVDQDTRKGNELGSLWRRAERRKR
jgi:hypothetical protein